MFHPSDIRPTAPDVTSGTAGQGAWYLAQLRPNQLSRARTNLERQSYGCFMPHRATTRRIGQRMKSALEPLFPGYLFVSIGAQQEWGPVNATYGVVRLVMARPNTPQPVPAALMDNLLAGTDSAGVVAPPADLSPGDTVRVHAGPMTGLFARVEQLDAAGRVGVLLEMMGQAVRTSIPAAHVQRFAG